MENNIKMMDFEYDLEERFVTALRAIFTIDDEFVYNVDSKQSKIIISGAFPEKDCDMQIPQIVVSAQSLSMSLQTSLFGGFQEDIIDANTGRIIGSKYATTIPYSMGLTCLTSKDSTSKNLANKVFKYISFTASEIFDNELSLNIQELNKVSGGIIRQIPDKAFAHSVSLRGVLYWQGTKEISPSSMSTIQKIKLNLQNNKERGVY